MNENRDPVACPSCGTVNPWMNENCRDCEASLENAEPANFHEPEPAVSDRVDENSQDRTRDSEEGKYSWQPWNWLRSSMPPGESGSSPRRLNARWILLGLFGYVVVFSVGHLLIEKQMVNNDPTRQAVYEKMQSSFGTISDEEREKYLEIFMPVIVAISLLFILTPVVMGLLIGFYAGGVKEGAISMGVSAVLILLTQGGQSADMAMLALFAVAFNAALGALGAVGGRLAREKIRDNG